MRCSDGSMQVREGLQLPDLRQNIIQLFFKHLTSPDEAIIVTAQQGLAHVISNHKMPKGLLQLSLRPILVNLAYHNKLKLPLLKGLARLLQLLASWFNVTLGTSFIPCTYSSYALSASYVCLKSCPAYMMSCLKRPVWACYSF